MAWPKDFEMRCLAVTACAVVACGSTSARGPSAARVYTGSVDGTDVQVALVASAHQTRIYFCGGPSSYTTMTRWFTLDLNSTGATHAQADASNDWTLDGQLAGSGASGSVIVADGTRLAFHATNVSPGTIAGLYEAEAGCGKVGLIVAQESAQAPPSGQGACISSKAVPSVEQVNPIRPLARMADGTIAVLVAGTTETVLVRAAAAPAD
jgi:hypothetical protein